MKKLIILYSIFLTTIQFAQSGITKEEIEEINMAIISNFGSEYSVADIMSVDRSKNTMRQFGFEIFDTYSTLGECFVFLAHVRDQNNDLGSSGIIGIYKNHTIIWETDPVIKCPDMRTVSIMGIMDLNRDGKIDIITSWDNGFRGGLFDIWILSWDGTSGWFINEIDQNGFSNIGGIKYDIGILDRDGDGILELCSSTGCYSWNSNLYGSWDDDPFPEIVPKDKLNTVVNCKVENIIDSYKYAYNLVNNVNSVQRVEQFGIEAESDNIRNFIKPENWDFYYIAEEHFISSEIELPVDSHPSAFVKPGEEKGGYTFMSSGLPKIKNIYIQGYNGERDFNIQNIRLNSFVTQTLAPSVPPDSLDAESFIDSLTSYTTQSLSLSWITDSLTAIKYTNYFSAAKTQLQQNKNNVARATLQTVLQEVDIDSTNNLTSEAYALLRYNTEYLLERIPQSSPNLLVNLKSSTGTLLTTGSLQYYEGSWKDAVNNGDGTFTVITNLINVSLRMTYEYAQQTVNNIPAKNNTYTFQTVSANVQLKNSLGSLIDTGTVQYYSGAWRSFGTTTNGIATKELLPLNYSFRMIYEYASIDKQQNLSVDPTVVFQTVNAAVRLKNSLGNLIDQGTVQYYAGAWRSFGTTTNGVATKELLPINYSFRMTYEFASIDKQQNLLTDPTVVFQTVNAQVQLKNSLGELMPAPMGVGTIQYYAGAWRNFGTTSNGVATKELLPINYSFRMTYEFASIDKQQNLSIDPTVVFQTVNAVVQLKNSLGSFMDQGTVQYYAGAWRSFGTTTSGVVTKELLPINYSFRMAYEFASIDKQQNLSTDPTVVFQTVNAAVQLKNSLGTLIDQGTVQYYAGAWRNFGTTTNGVATKELLPINYSFRMTHEFLSKDKQQNLSTNPVVDFTTVLCSVQVSRTNNQPINNSTVKYYAGAWRDIGLTNPEGITTKELLPQNISFRASYGNVSLDKQQDIGVNSLVEIQLAP